MTCKTCSKTSGKFVLAVLVVGFGGKDTCTEERMFWKTEKFKFNFIRNLHPLCKSNRPGFESSFRDQEVR